MDLSYRVLLAALLGIGALGFLSVLWVVPAYYKFIPRRLELVTRALYCAIGCGYIGSAYLALRDARPIGAFVVVLMVVSTLNLVALAVERPWSRRDRQSRPPAA